MISWIQLILAGLCEIVWAMGLKFSGGFTKPLATTITIIFMIASFYFLALATRVLPISVAYTIWVGIGALGAFIGGVTILGEKVSLLQCIYFIIIMIGILGLKITSIK